MKKRGNEAIARTLALLLVCLVPVLACAGGDGGESAAEGSSATSSPPAEISSAGSAVSNPNLAGAEELGALPHMSAALVDAIMEQRPLLGSEALNAVVSQHLSAEQAEELYVEMFVPINLNTASEPEILLVPGVGDRMAHEFDEYRPTPPSPSGGARWASTWTTPRSPAWSSTSSCRSTSTRPAKRRSWPSRAWGAGWRTSSRSTGRIRALSSSDARWQIRRRRRSRTYGALRRDSAVGCRRKRPGFTAARRASRFCLRGTLVWCPRSLVATEETQAPLWQGGTTRRSRSYGKEFQRCPERMHAAPNGSRTSGTPH